MMSVIVGNRREDLDHGLVVAERKHDDPMLLFGQTIVTLKSGVIQGGLAEIGGCIHWKPGIRLGLLDARLPFGKMIFGRLGMKGEKRFARSGFRGMVEITQLDFSL